MEPKARTGIVQILSTRKEVLQLRMLSRQAVCGIYPAIQAGGITLEGIHIMRRLWPNVKADSPLLVPMRKCRARVTSSLFNLTLAETRRAVTWRYTMAQSGIQILNNAICGPARATSEALIYHLQEELMKTFSLVALILLLCSLLCASSRRYAGREAVLYLMDDDVHERCEYP